MAGMIDDYAPEAPSPEDLATTSGAVLLDFGTNWCGHCQECIDKFRAAGPSASCPLYTANFDTLIKPSGYDKKWGITGFPTFIMFSGTNPIRRKEDGGRETSDFVQFAAS